MKNVLEIADLSYRLQFFYASYPWNAYNIS